MPRTSLQAELEQLVKEEQDHEVLEAVVTILRMAQEHRSAAMKLALIERILMIDDPDTLQRISDMLSTVIAVPNERIGSR
jgi:hypothetical protein